MILWRISEYSTLDGGGGLDYSGRWHNAGHAVVYCAPNPATALLEVLVHAKIDIQDLPLSVQYLEVDTPDRLAIEFVDSSGLGTSWQTDQAVTRRVGDEWLQSGRTPLLRVPCVIVPATWNFLINPEHRESEAIRVVQIHSLVLDQRLRTRTRYN